MGSHLLPPATNTFTFKKRPTFFALKEAYSFSYDLIHKKVGKNENLQIQAPSYATVRTQGPLFKTNDVVN